MTVLAVKDGQTFFSHLSDCSMRHSVLLMNEIDKVLKAADLSLKKCEFFSSVVGPGSFTGIRIGISAIKGFCLATGKPSLPVTSFESMAYNSVDGKKCLGLVDALHDRYYVCGFQNGKQILSPVYLDCSEVLRLVREENYAPCAFEPLMLDTEIMLLDPVKGLRESVLALSESGRFGALEALYIRKSQAEEQLGRV